MAHLSNSIHGYTEYLIDLIWCLELDNCINMLVDFVKLRRETSIHFITEVFTNTACYHLQSTKSGPMFYKHCLHYDSALCHTNLIPRWQKTANFRPETDNLQRRWSSLPLPRPADTPKRTKIISYWLCIIDPNLPNKNRNINLVYRPGYNKNNNSNVLTWCLRLLISAVFQWLPVTRMF